LIQRQSPEPTPQRASTDDDLLPIVNERDELIGVKSRRLVHVQGLRHRAAHVAVFDRGGRLWLQKRASTKDASPGMWDLSATGHVDPGETYEQAARRELREELAIDAEPSPVVKREASERSGWEFYMLFRLIWEGPIDDYNRDEIERMRLFTLDEIRAASDRTGSEFRMTNGVVDDLPHLFDAARGNPESSLKTEP
jgi:isopentenyldiphosphate isomerase